MTVLSYLTNVANNAVLNSGEEFSIDTSIETIKSHLKNHFGGDIFEHFRFGSSTRGTILPRRMDDNSDIDYMVVFSDSNSKPDTCLNKLRHFAEKHYSTSNFRQSSPFAIVLELNHIKFKLVPAIKEFWGGYKIPDPSSNNSEWMPTDPDEFNQVLMTANKVNKNLINPLVRLVKYWNSQSGGIFNSFILENKIVAMRFPPCADLKEYFYYSISNLEPDYFDEQWKKDRLTTARYVIGKTKKYESNGKASNAEKEIKKLIPEL